MATTKKQLIKDNKMKLIEWLRVDSPLILQYAQSKGVITDAEYAGLKTITNPDDANCRLLDKVYDKGEDKCAQFLRVMKDRQIQETYPELAKWMTGLSATASGSGEGSPKSGLKHMIGDQHFIDKYRCELIDRVSSVDPILDRLLQEKVITQENYSDIRHLATSYKKMRELMEIGNIRSKSSKGKDILYDVLLKEESFLMDELKQGC